MMDAEEFFNGLAEVYEAGAYRARSWSLNTDRLQDAEIHAAMALRARLIAGHAAEIKRMRKANEDEGW